MNSELKHAANAIFEASIREGIERLRREAVELPLGCNDRLALFYAADQLEMRFP